MCVCVLCGVGEKGGREKKSYRNRCIMYYYGVCVTACRSKEKKEKQGGYTETYFFLFFVFSKLVQKLFHRYCPRCEKHRPAIKQMSLWKLPRFLVVHLKRFLFHNSVWRSKIDHLVSFPLRWVLIVVSQHRFVIVVSQCRCFF